MIFHNKNKAEESSGNRGGPNSRAVRSGLTFKFGRLKKPHVRSPDLSGVGNLQPGKSVQGLLPGSRPSGSLRRSCAKIRRNFLYPLLFVTPIGSASRNLASRDKSFSDNALISFGALPMGKVTDFLLWSLNFTSTSSSTPSEELAHPIPVGQSEQSVVVDQSL